jgi:tRNA A-37 threonylcarbamoyl transferase component Bud32
MTRLLTPNPDTTAPVQAPAPGEVLGGKYRVEREIGSGGMGIVYEVTHLVMTKKRFAVKWLLPLPDGYQGEDAQAAARRFVREAEIAGGICHPNVVEVYDVTVSDSGCFMVMELLDGESLEARLKREGKLSVAEACRITVACASGVGAAHAANVIHRDLKPANIFLMQLPEAGPSRPKVLDFGISRFTAPNGSVQSTVTRAGTLIGTPMYMAPEQLRGFECDARTDVYGLGVTLYEALTGKPAYQAPTHADLVVRILTGDAHEMRELEPSVPAGLAAVVMQALHHKPEQRFASVQAFAEALQPYVSYSAAQATSGGKRVEARRRKAAWAVGLVIAAGVAGAGVLAARWVSNQGVVAPASRVEVSDDVQAPPADVAVTGVDAPVPTPPPTAAEAEPPQPTAAQPVAGEATPKPNAAPARNTTHNARQRSAKSPSAVRPAPVATAPEPPARTPKPRPPLDSL